ncbi:MAG: fasciclin domain-containing protein [Rhizobacter sp.]
MNATTFSTLLVAALLAGGCASTPTPTSVADTAARTPQLSTLNKLIADAGLQDTLRAGGPYTVFAPSDEAFKAVPAKTMAELSADKALLRSVLTYHVLPAKVASADVKNGNAKTVQGANLALGKSGTFVTVEEAMVVEADVPATNGVVHIIDRVLIPPKR